MKYHKLRAYEQEVVDYIRELKNDLYREISLGSKSRYFSKPESKYTDLDDYNIDQLKSEYLTQYDKIDEDEMIGILNFAIYLYHLR